MTNPVKVGNLIIGGGAPVSVQSMCTAKTSDADATISQINELEACGCRIIRVAVPDEESAEAIYKIKSNINIPLVADIHFDYRLALMCIERGVDKIRINPGNIGDKDRIKKVVDSCKAKNIPIRIGVNGGSLEKDIVDSMGVCSDAIVKSAERHISILESFDFNNIVVSLKSSDVSMMIDAYRKISQKYSYPLHLGVTEAGTYMAGTIKSAIGIGSLLCDGIGDTIRVSLTDDPKNEVLVGYDILNACGLLNNRIKIVSCPTCARCKIDLISVANKVSDALSGCSKPIKVAIMGCAVNGPGEARDADIGIAGGNKEALLFKKGEIISKIKEENIVSVLLSEIEKM